MTKRFDYRREVVDSVNKEFNNFYDIEMQKTKEEIFADAHKIFAYTALKDFITAEESQFSDDIHYRYLYAEKDSILALLYDEYCKNEYASLATSGDVLEFIEDDYNAIYHEGILEEAEELE